MKRNKHSIYAGNHIATDAARMALDTPYLSKLSHHCAGRLVSFQGLGEELSALAGPYSSSRGVLLTAKSDQTLAGCCASRLLESMTCSNAFKIKRLFARPPAAL